MQEGEHGEKVGENAKDNLTKPGTTITPLSSTETSLEQKANGEEKEYVKMTEELSRDIVEAQSMDEPKEADVESGSEERSDYMSEVDNANKETTNAGSEYELKPTIVELPELQDGGSTKVRTSIAEESSHDDNNEADDVKRKAALALAAVAAAASAKNKSPAEAAREARAVAHSFISSAADEKDDRHDRKGASSNKFELRSVSLTAVRNELQSRNPQSPLLKKLSEGGNDALLQVLLLLEYFSAVDGGVEDSMKVDADKSPRHPKQTTIDSEPIKQYQEQDIRDACDCLEMTLKKVDGAYQSLVDLLPKGKSTLSNDINEIDEVDRPVVVSDLLPSCSPPQGDMTAAFFRACMGDVSVANQDRKATGSTESFTLDAGLEQPVDHKEKSETISKTTNSVFASMFRRVGPKQSFFGKSTQEGLEPNDEDTRALPQAQSRNSNSDYYEVKIEREMLGLTVENVLERTVVRTVAPGGPAKKAGAKVGSLIVKVGNVDTKNLTHFETIDELRQSNRPLTLILRPVADDALRLAREEMGRLIKGSGFGNMMDGNRVRDSVEPSDDHGETPRPLIGADLRIDAYTNLVRRRFAEIRDPVKNKKEEALFKVGEKVLWVLLLFVIGLQDEERHLLSLSGNTSNADSAASPRRNPHSVYHHSSRDYGDAAKSVAKVVLDYTRMKLVPKANPPGKVKSGLPDAGLIKRRKGLPPPFTPTRDGKGAIRPTISSDLDSSLSHEKPLLQIGDVLQRTRTFLADTTSPPAALLRGELISLLCDILDIDTEMELSEEEALSATAGRTSQEAGAINDLGTAGSLLKLIVMSCPIMKSPGCDSESGRPLDPELEAELRRRFGSKGELSSSDIHRLHAGNRFLAVVHRLAASRSTSARITACSLGPVLWGHLDFPHQLQLRGVITRALHDVDVMVRKATAKVLHEIAELVFDPRSVPWLVLMCERSMTDPEPHLRSAAMTLTWHLAEHLPNAFLGDASQGSRYLRRLPSRDDPTFAEVYLLQCKLLPVATRLAEDRSPSVRLSVAAQCDRLCDALGAHWSSVVIDTLLALLSDSDERVRCEAVACVPRLSQIVMMSTNPGEAAPSEVSILEALIPASIKLQKDASVSVRVSLASAVGDLLALLVSLQNRGFDVAVDPSSLEKSLSADFDTVVHYKKHVDDRLIPTVQTLLNDSDPEVTSAALRAVTNATRTSSHQARARHASIASLDDDSVSISSYASEKPVVVPVLSEKQVLRLLPTLAELGNSKQWRVRQSAVEIVPALLGCTQQHGTRSEIAKLCVQLMGDKVDAVRKTAAECLCMGGSSLGSHGEDAAAEWISSIVIPNVRKAAIHSDCKQRLLSLKMMETLLLNGACASKWQGNCQVEERMTNSPVQELAAIALSLSTDRIANVRLNVGRCLEAVLHNFEEEEIRFIETALIQQLESEREMESGGDQDVVYFAKKCITRARSLVEERRSNLTI
ncbi:hypothetical protein FisN_24Lh219 [Fistulifera solaris]|uniref:PDZ domain-containing protein n=1 Tax=Fistulifera solaris TaxID=1519565 RepID=A0A1Z5K9H7_FISSO|nr:hypothetical protein FisN_24Lh219 [Fistulifera solaris]|eukprot:GAX22930.1 hypothetical protein FisN_24Lh219 [Fistulifera solaris]